MYFNLILAVFFFCVVSIPVSSAGARILKSYIVEEKGSGRKSYRVFRSGKNQNKKNQAPRKRILGESSPFSCIHQLSELEVVTLIDVSNSSYTTSDVVKSHLVSIGNLQKINPSTKFAVGSFTDRPYVAPRSFANGDHCLIVENGMDHSLPAYEKAIQELKFSSTRALKGGQFDALTATVEDVQIGWKDETLREGALRVILLVTGSAPHIHGELNETAYAEPVPMTGCQMMEYPSLKEIRSGMRRASASLVIVTAPNHQYGYSKFARKVNRDVRVVSHGHSEPTGLEDVTSDISRRLSVVKDFDMTVMDAIEAVCEERAIFAAPVMASQPQLPQPCIRDLCIKKCKGKHIPESKEREMCEKICHDTQLPCNDLSMASLTQKSEISPSSNIQGRKSRPSKMNRGGCKPCKPCGGSGPCKPCKPCNPCKPCKPNCNGNCNSCCGSKRTKVRLSLDV